MSRVNSTLVMLMEEQGSHLKVIDSPKKALQGSLKSRILHIYLEKLQSESFSPAWITARPTCVLYEEEEEVATARV